MLKQPNNDNSQQANDNSQKAVARGSVTQVKGDYINTRTTTISIPLFFIGIVAFGALAWAINSGLLNNSGSPEVPTSPSVLPAK